MSVNRLVVLAGNGVSIAANPNFRLSTLTELIRSELANIDDGALVEILHKQYSRFDFPLVLSIDFEEFIGAMYDRYLDLRNLEELLLEQYGAFDPKTISVESAAEVVWKMSRKAVAGVLRVIGEQSSSVKANVSVIDAFLQVVKHKFATNADFFTVNYDNLLLESMLRIYTGQNMYDLANGDVRNVLLSSGQSIQAHILRTTTSDFGGLGCRAGLFHLHGSLAYWRAGEKGPDLKVLKRDILSSQLLLSELEGYDSFRPLVLLGRWPTKWQTVRQQPFSLSYQLLESKLASATHLLIAGSSLREDAIMELIGKAIKRADEDGMSLSILVVDTKIVAREDFEKIIGRFVELGRCRFKYFSSSLGIEGMAEAREWQLFCETSPSPIQAP